jgi:RIO kinase 1
MSPYKLDVLLDADYTWGEKDLPTTLKRARRPYRNKAEMLAEMVQHVEADSLGADSVFNPTFTSSHYERGWILHYLSRFHDEGLIRDVLRKVKGGKEANVYCCAAHPGTHLELIAAKLYRPRMFRNLRNDAVYRQGRTLLDERGKEVAHQGRELRAVEKGTAHGQQLQITSWLSHEYQALQILHAAGADVPRPLAQSENVILMEYLGDPVLAAPALNEVRLPNKEARQLFERLLRNVELMLAHDCIHGDLSAYNVLYWEGDVRIIDLPQVVNPRKNPDALDILERDLSRLAEYFEPHGLRCRPARLARDLWARYVPAGQSAREAVAMQEEVGEE